MSKIFIDTNILVYALDKHNPQKQKTARKKLHSLTNDTIFGVISTQVLQEFYVTATKKLSVEPLTAKNIMHSFENFEVISIDPPLIKEAIDCSILNQITFWDALIIVSAESAKCDTLWSEDLTDRQIIRGVQIQNIFKGENN